MFQENGMNCEILFTIPLNLFCLKYIQKARIDSNEKKDTCKIY